MREVRKIERHADLPEGVLPDVEDTQLLEVTKPR